MPAEIPGRKWLILLRTFSRGKAKGSESRGTWFLLMLQAVFMPCLPIRFRLVSFVEVQVRKVLWDWNWQ